MKKLKPFNYEEYIAGPPAKVQFRNGVTPAYLKQLDVGGPDNILVIHPNGSVYWHYPDGRYNFSIQHPLDLFLVEGEETQEAWLAVRKVAGEYMFDPEVYRTKKEAEDVWGTWEEGTLVDIIKVEFKS